MAYGDADADTDGEKVEDAAVVVDAAPVPTMVLEAGVAVVVGAGALEEGEPPVVLSGFHTEGPAARARWWLVTQA